MINPLDDRIPGDITDLDEAVGGVTQNTSKEDIDKLEENDELADYGDSGIGSTVPDLEDDDDVDKNAESVGIGVGDSDTRRPLNIARDVEIAENIHKNQ